MTCLVDEDAARRPFVLLSHGLDEPHVLEPFLEPRYNAQASRRLAYMLPESSVWFDGGGIVRGVDVG